MSRRFVALLTFAAVLLGAGCGHGSAHRGSPWVVFASDRDGRWDVYAVHPDGSGLIRVTARRTAMFPHLAASPDGRWLAIVAGDRTIVFDEHGQRSLRPGGDAYAKALIDRRGKVSQWPADGRVPSPDGKYVVVTNERGEFRVGPAHGGKPKRLVRGANGPAWSPDGDLVTFSVPAGGPKYDPILDLAVARPDGSDLRKVTHSTEGEGAYDASWSPDGRQLVYVRGHSPNVGRFDLDQIWIVGRDGTNARALTRAYPMGGENNGPVWFDGTLRAVSAPSVVGTRRVGKRVELRTRYPVGEVRIHEGRVAVLPMTHSPQTPQPSSPLVFWTPASGTIVSRSISRCSQAEGLGFDGQSAVFDCNNSCCDSTEESVRAYMPGEAVPVEIADAYGGGPTGDFISGYALDDGVVVYAAAHDRSERLDRIRLWRFDRGRKRPLPGPAGTVLAFGGGRIALARNNALEITDARGALLYPPVATVDTESLLDVFSSQPRRGPQVRLDARSLVVLDHGMLRSWDARTGAHVRDWPLPRGAHLEALSQGRVLLVAGSTVHVIRLADGHDTILRFPQAKRTNPSKQGAFYGFYPEYVLYADLDGRTLVVAYNVGLIKEPGRVVVVHVA